MIYFDNAATTNPKPPSVINAVSTAMVKYCANPGRSGYDMSLAAGEMIYSVRHKLSDFFGAAGEDKIVFTQSCTQALNTAMQGLIFPGESFAISSLEHNAVFRCAEHLKSTGSEYFIYNVDDNDDKTLQNLEMIIGKVKVVVCLHASNVTGKILPIEKIGRMCRDNGILFIVDAAQTAGVLPIDMQKMCIDYLCIAPHKGLYAPMGTGVLITDGTPNPLIYGGTGSDSNSAAQPSFTPDKYESGTLNVPGIAGIDAGIDFIKQKDVYRHEMMIVQHIYNELSKDDKLIFYNKPSSETVPLLLFNVKNMQSEQTAALLSKSKIAVRAGLHCAPLAHKSIGTLSIGAVRVAPSAFTTIYQADKLISAVKSI